MAKFRASPANRGWVRVLGYGLGVRNKKVKSPRDRVLASDLASKSQKLNNFLGSMVDQEGHLLCCQKNLI